MARKLKKVFSLLIAVSLLCAMGITALADGGAAQVSVKGTVTGYEDSETVYLFADGAYVTSAATVYSTENGWVANFGERDKFRSDGTTAINYVISFSSTDVTKTSYSETVPNDTVVSRELVLDGIAPCNELTWYQGAKLVIFHKGNQYVLWSQEGITIPSNVEIKDYFNTLDFSASANSFKSITVDACYTGDSTEIPLNGETVSLTYSNGNVAIEFTNPSVWSTFAIGYIENTYGSDTYNYSIVTTIVDVPQDPDTYTLTVTKAFNGYTPADFDADFTVYDIDGDTVATATYGEDFDANSAWTLDVEAGSYYVTEANVTQTLGEYYSYSGATINYGSSSTALSVTSETVTPTITVTNSYADNTPGDPDTYTLTVTKAFNGYTPADFNADFTVYDINGDAVATATYGENFDANSAWTLDVEAGSYYVTESNVSQTLDTYYSYTGATIDYGSDSDSNTITIPSNTADPTITVTNNYTDNTPGDPDTYTLTVTKAFNGYTPTDFDAVFTVYTFDGQSASVKDTENFSNFTNGEWKLDVEAGSYYVTETNISQSLDTYYIYTGANIDYGSMSNTLTVNGTTTAPTIIVTNNYSYNAPGGYSSNYYYRVDYVYTGYDTDGNVFYSDSVTGSVVNNGVSTSKTVLSDASVAHDSHDFTLTTDASLTANLLGHTSSSNPYVFTFYYEFSLLADDTTPLSPEPPQASEGDTLETITDEDSPLASTPEIIEDDVPLASAPVTGDNDILFISAAVMLVSLAGIVIIIRRKLA